MYRQVLGNTQYGGVDTIIVLAYQYPAQPTVIE
jgi:hypothetical protein